MVSSYVRVYLIFYGRNSKAKIKAWSTGTYRVDCPSFAAFSPVEAILVAAGRKGGAIDEFVRVGNGFFRFPSFVALRHGVMVSKQVQFKFRRRNGQHEVTMARYGATDQVLYDCPSA